MQHDIPHVLQRCQANQYISDILDTTQFICLALFSALRVYALLDGKILVPGIVLSLNLVPVATNLLREAKTVVVMDISLGTRTAVIIGDVLVLLVTWSKTAKSYREARQLKIKAPLTTLLFRYGTFHFIILLIINVLEMIEYNILFLRTMQVSSSIMQTLPSLIVCRFVLNLRQVKPAGNSWISGSQSISLRFVGNAGELLQFGSDEEEKKQDHFPGCSAQAEEPDNVLPETTSNSDKDMARNGINTWSNLSSKIIV
ncbi:hypothetical protein BDY19DRAFT_995495 [Irpex rosettiformis]|uniref:Uncharacterized protein n=1 Tax=Irpex rosettiformis TaxID=378272 RepID=A0ACB8TXD7_9APHY|nr:hypothetical protein BDY19DRAFT_995495 [Irpex rosettiformis]